MEEYIKAREQGGLLGTLLSAKRRLLKDGQPLIDLSMINPDLDPPRLALDKLTEATLNRKNHRYSVARGVRKFRESFAEKYKSAFGVELDPEEEIVSVAGTKDALLLALRHLCVSGDKVLVGAPTYPLYKYAAEYHRLITEEFLISPNEDEMLFSIEEKLSQGNFKVLILNFPNNPTGISVSKAFYERLAVIVKAHGTTVINDFVYGELSYSGIPFQSALSVDGLRSCCIETYSLSKTYSVPGWRTGALLGAASVIGGVSKIKSLIDYGTFLPIQYAASTLLIDGRSAARQISETYAARARLMGKVFSELGLGVNIPEGGASLWLKIPDEERNPGAFFEDLLIGEGVSVLPGEVFGADFSRYFRCALVVNEEKIHDIGRALSRFLDKRSSDVPQISELRPTGI